MSSSIRHVGLKRTFYPSEALRERICIVHLYGTRDFFFLIKWYWNMQTVRCSLTLLELVIYNDSLLLVPHLEIGDKSSDKLPTMVSKWRALYPRVPRSLLSWHCIIADPARLSINDRSWSQLRHRNELHWCTLCLDVFKGEERKKLLPSEALSGTNEH